MGCGRCCASDALEFGDTKMRAEVQIIVDEIKQSLELLRRHL
jgi:hypothetical protein